MKILFFDLETNGLDTERCDILELAAIQWDTDKRRVLNSFSHIIYSDIAPILSDITKINKIDDAMIKGGVPLASVLNRFSLYVDRSDYLCAHNGLNFDKPIIDRWLTEKRLPRADKPLIDTRIDIEYPLECKSVSLQELAKHYKIVPADPHAALSDVQTMLDIFSRHDMQAAMRRAHVPTIKIIAEVPYEKKDLAKDRRYQWDRVAKVWYKLIRETDLERHQSEALANGFKVRNEKNGQTKDESSQRTFH